MNKKIISLVLASSMWLSSVSASASFTENDLKKHCERISTYVQNHPNEFTADFKKKASFECPSYDFLAKKTEAEKQALLTRREACDTMKILGFDGELTCKPSFNKFDIFKNWLSNSKVGSVYSFTTDILSKFTSLGKKFDNIYFYIFMVPYIADMINVKLLAPIKKIFADKFFDFDKCVKIYKEKMKEVKGQDQAKAMINSKFLSVLHEKNLTAKLGQKSKGANVFYFAGCSGCGKTLSANYLAEAFGCKDPFVVEAASVDCTRKESIKEQLFEIRDFKRGGMTYQNDPDFIKAIKQNKVVIINEYDKMWSPALDEMLRGIVDDGYISYAGQRIDCRGMIFIITSNESTASLQGKRINPNDKSTIDDGTGSRTYIMHDKSFLNRINIVEFATLSKQAHIEIVRTEFEELAKKFKNLYKIDIDFDSAVEPVAVHAMSKKQGARPTKQILRTLIAKLVTLTGNKDKKLKISYDDALKLFTIQEIDKNGKIIENSINEKVEVVFEKEDDVDTKLQDVENLVRETCKTDIKTLYAGKMKVALEKKQSALLKEKYQKLFDSKKIVPDASFLDMFFSLNTENRLKVIEIIRQNLEQIGGDMESETFISYEKGKVKLFKHSVVEKIGLEEKYGLEKIVEIDFNPRKISEEQLKDILIDDDMLKDLEADEVAAEQGSIKFSDLIGKIDAEPSNQGADLVNMQAQAIPATVDVA